MSDLYLNKAVQNAWLNQESIAVTSRSLSLEFNAVADAFKVLGILVLERKGAQFLSELRNE